MAKDVNAIIEQIEKLKQMKEDGIISEEEFNTLKSNVIEGRFSPEVAPAPVVSMPKKTMNDSSQNASPELRQIMEAVKPVVSSQLKSPASAIFDYNLITVKKVGEDINVAGFVDSQNGYGAMIRNDFTATLRIVNGQYVITGTTVAVEANKQRTSDFVSNYIAISIFTGIGGLILYFFISALV